MTVHADSNWKVLLTSSLYAITAVSICILYCRFL